MKSENSNSDKHHVVHLPMNKKCICDELGVSLFILNNWIAAVEAELGKPVGRLYSIKQVNFLIERYGSKYDDIDGDTESD